MAWPDSADPAYVKAYRRAYYLAHKAHENRGRVIRARRHRERQIEYLKSKGLWPIIPEERRYEIPPNLRVIALAKAIKRDSRSKQGRHRPAEAEEVLHGHGEGGRIENQPEGRDTCPGDSTERQ